MAWKAGLGKRDEQADKTDLSGPWGRAKGCAACDEIHLPRSKQKHGFTQSHCPCGTTMSSIDIIHPLLFLVN
jgi:hypothetical protein